MGKYDHLTREELICLLEQSEKDNTDKLRNRLEGERYIAQALMIMLQNYDGNYEEEIMRIVLERYQADRAFLFRFDWESSTNSNVQEVHAEGISPEIQNLQNLPNEALGKYLDQFSQGIPLIVEDIEKMEAPDYQGGKGMKDIFRHLQLKSAILFPMHIFRQLWGFVGMETVKNYRTWTEDDIEWLKAFTDILSIGVSQKLMRTQAAGNERRFSELFQNMPVGYVRHRILCDEQHQPVDYEYLEVNPAFEKLVHLTKEQCVGKTARQILPHFNEEAFKLYVEIAYEGKQSQLDYYTPLLNRWFYSVLYSPKRGEFISLFYDITERYTATEQIRQNEKKLRSVFENLPIGIINYDPKGQFINCNKEAAKLFRITNKKQGEYHFSFTPSHLKILKHKSFRSVDFIYDPVSRSCIQEQAPVPSTAIYLHGKFIRYTDRHGAPMGYLLSVIDNTKIYRTNQELSQTEKALTENLVRLSLILETGEIYPWYMDRETGILDITEKFYEAFQQKKQDYLNYTLEDLRKKIHPKDLAIFEEEYHKLEKGTTARTKTELRINAFARGYKWYELNAAVQTSPGSSKTKWLGFLTNIQKRKDNEQQLIQAIKKAEESDKLKSAFLANVSHEIRTPLNAIIGFSELVATSENEEDKNYYLDIVRTNNDLLLNLINDILDLSKIEAGRMDLKESAVGLSEVCRELCEIHQLRAQPGVKILFQAPRENLILQTDRNRLVQVYSNLIHNAVKNTTQGSIQIGYRRKNDQVICFVKDTGKGIPKDKQALIFNRFEKLDSTNQGFGLGLSICKSIIEKLGGQISFTSEIHQGSEFRFTLPYRASTLCVPSSASSLPVDEQSPASSVAKDHTTVLIAEDTDNYYSLLQTLAGDKYQLLRATNGIEAISLFSEAHPDLILVDLKIPELNGIEITQIIREADPHIPIIVLAALSCESDKAEALKAGCNDFLIKPLNKKQLQQLLGQYAKS